MNNFEGIDTGGRRGGKMKTFCPKCRDQRKNKRDKSLSVDLDKGVAKCHYCGEVFCRKNVSRSDLTQQTRYAERPKTPIPVAPRTVPTEEHIQWFAKERAIRRETLQRIGVGSGEEWMPQTGKKEWCICFNYYENGKLVNIKFRDLDKNFKMVSGAELIPYNIDGILGTPECIFVEGETDALSFAEIGRTDVISVPAGANTNLVWMDRFVETHFEDKQVIYIAVDNDRKGLELQKELVGRLGAERCKIVDYPTECKDANEVLVKYGPKALVRMLEEAQEVPLEGVFTVKDVSRELRILFEEGIQPGAKTGWRNFDKLCTFETGRVCVITGVPGAGKSEFVDELVMRLNLNHAWKAVFFSPENMPLTYHVRKLMEKVGGRPFCRGDMPEAVYCRAEHYLQQNFSFIQPEEDFTVDHILDIARMLVRKQGIKILSVDPFNRFEHQIPHGQTETQYISAVLDKFSNFALRNNCLVIITAHPRKMNKATGQLKEPVPTLYDINGSAAFYNKCDFGVVVERDDVNKLVRIHVQKVKFKHLGGKGEAAFEYNPDNGRLAPCEVDKQTQKACNVERDNEEWVAR